MVFTRPITGFCEEAIHIFHDFKGGMFKNVVAKSTIVTFIEDIHRFLCKGHEDGFFLGVDRLESMEVRIRKNTVELLAKCQVGGGFP